MIEAALYPLLHGDAGVTALVEDRIFPTLIPEGRLGEGDCIRFEVLSDVPEAAMGVDSGLCRARVQIEGWSTSAPGARAVLQAVFAVLRRYRGTQAGYVIQDVLTENLLSGGWDETAQRFIHQADFLIGYLEA